MSDVMPGTSFFRRRDTDVFHAYSTYARGLDILIAAPKGRDERLDSTMQRVRHDDRYVQLSLRSGEYVGRDPKGENLYAENHSVLVVR